MLAPWILALFMALTSAGSKPDLSQLTSSQRQAYRTVITEEFCSCDSALTVSGCLELRPECRTAERLSDITLRAVQAGATSDETLAFLSRNVMGPTCAEAKPLEVRGMPSKGPKNAPVTMIEFADFRCGHCKRAAPVVREAADHYKGQVRVVFAPFPLQDHPHAMAAAEAAMAAAEQGKFWPMHDALFAHPDGAYTPEVLRRIARKVGLNMSKFNASMKSHKHRDAIEQAKKAGLAAGVEATPSFFVNGRRHSFDATLFTFSDRFSMELDRNSGACK